MEPIFYLKVSGSIFCIMCSRVLEWPTRKKNVKLNRIITYVCRSRIVKFVLS